MSAMAAREHEDFATNAAAGGAVKRYFHGTHRTCTPQETLARMKPLLPVLGITRIANVTGSIAPGYRWLWCAGRMRARLRSPKARGLRWMPPKRRESWKRLEVWHAEHIMNPLKLASSEEMRTEHRVADVEGLPRTRASRYTASLAALVDRRLRPARSALPSGCRSKS